MLFGSKLKNDVYPPWKESYIDYDFLKSLLKEPVDTNRVSGDNVSWTNDDESRFVEALDGQLEKVYTFQSERYNSLMEKLNRLEDQSSTEEKIKNLDFETFQAILEDTLAETKELDNFSRLNYTGFVKIVKKHDKVHPQFPSVKALLKVRLQELPFHSEGYSPLLYQISYLYNIFRSNSTVTSESMVNGSKLSSVARSNSANLNFKSFKFWVHRDNLMEVKTRILRHLPVLVYAAAPTENDNDADNIIESRFESNTFDSPSLDSSNDPDNAIVSTKSMDPFITSLYFDNEDFTLYNDKLLKTHEAPTLRIRWNGKLVDNKNVFMEKRMLVQSDDTSTGSNTNDLSSFIEDFQETRIRIEPKYLNGFIFNGDEKYKEKVLKKLKESGTMDSELNKIGKDFDVLKIFIIQENLQPIFRTIFTRTAFQIPGDDRIRITIDSDIVYIREDCFDKNRPIRDPKVWHRNDIDSNVKDPLKLLRKGEYVKFPYSVMEIKIKNNESPSMINTIFNNNANKMSNTKLPRKHGQWITELTNSHLVKEVPKFSKYIQGVASLYSDDDKLDSLPFWLPELESDIKINPKDAYYQEEQKKKKQQEVQKKLDNMRRLSNVSKSKPVGNGVTNYNTSENINNMEGIPEGEADLEDHDSSDDDTENNPNRGPSSNTTTINNRKKSKKNVKKKDPTFLNILTGRDSKLVGYDSEEEEIELPPGVIEPTSYIKNAGPVKVEAKVWLANERTFNRWLRVCTLLSVLTFSIYNSVKKSEFPKLANLLAYIYFSLTLFCGLWSYKIYLKRLSIIKQRSGEHLDAPLGPMLVAGVLFMSLIINFVVAFRVAAKKRLIVNTLENTGDIDMPLPENLQAIESFVLKVLGI
ncbi:hypothetical protein TBLA_0D02660 [Henningerozyma blattae CBS 6284]|uniref:SPX domain-containing protein n=1 Tax=Henningerozyma blattae (strain ATCC 34711 / CBS 6284 / DSM 70876 / NBRC 10599 / NRRL Y-10934 / UCD 77-7) TaxID=1071380 RepID=I2H317_HENB6|nr:hypothetical protein TBLA_0D02660 [Tetrapisispora blattae CBS 6284]CCH60769.1 hypothetical protein TBLA_0D02660 [Tetrapisispora blattae CBS 6284]